MDKHDLKPTVIVIFGGSGDLTNRKLVPAFFNLYLDQQMPAHFAVIGLGRTKYTDKKFREELKEGVDEFSRRGKPSKEEWDAFAPKISYMISDVFSDESYQNIADRIDAIGKEWKVKPNVLFYLSIAPTLIEPVTRQLGKLKICKDPDCTRIVVEKPFGHNLESAIELNALLTSMFEEKQIYRIDHYLGKEAVQNMLVFRFANVLFEPVWNSKYIENIQITVSETVGVEDRGGYYDKSGALKDMIQNHVLQLLTFVAMEVPVSFSADEIRSRKVDVLRAIRKYSTASEVFENSARGQYGEGWMKGEKVPGYREEDKVAKKSPTDTFAAVKFYVDNWRWQGVPFYVRSGKRMPEKMSVISIQFGDVPHQIFPSKVADSIRPNRIIISISPSTGIRLRFQAKKVGLDMKLSPADLVFNYSETYDTQPPEAYETLLNDVMTGDATLFMRSDEVEAAWAVVMPIVKAWENNEPSDFPNYAVNSWGPESAERLIARDGYHWVTMPIKKKKE